MTDKKKPTTPVKDAQIALRLPPELLARTDDAAAATGVSRTGFIRMALIEKLKRTEQ